MFHLVSSCFILFHFVSSRPHLRPYIGVSSCFISFHLVSSRFICFIWGEDGPVNLVELSIAHINIASLRHKVHDIHKILHGHGIHVWSVNETWLDDSISDAAVHIPGYSIFRRDRERHGGGVALYIQSTLPVKLLPLPSLVTAMVDSPEVLLVEIRVPNSVRDDRITVGTVYRSPAQPVGFWDGLSSAVDSIIARNEKTILLGDLNVNVLDTISPQYGRLRQYGQEFCFRNLVTQPTRPLSGKCLDLALCSEDFKTNAYCHFYARYN